MISGQRLAKESMLVSKLGVIDGPFAETKEVIGGYWHFVVGSWVLLYLIVYIAPFFL